MALYPLPSLCLQKLLDTAGKLHEDRKLRPARLDQIPLSSSWAAGFFAVVPPSQFETPPLLQRCRLTCVHRGCCSILMVGGHCGVSVMKILQTCY